MTIIIDIGPDLAKVFRMFYWLSLGCFCMYLLCKPWGKA